MGCDIHLFTEKKIKIYCKDGTQEEKWVCCDYFKLNPYYIDNKDDKRKYDIVNIYSDRDYKLFSVLANVRNYDKIEEVLDEPRGLPYDVSDAVKKECKEWGVIGHSHSWFYAKELFLYKLKYNNNYLDKLIDAVVKKMQNEFLILFSQDDVKAKKLVSNLNNFRIVFWFDN